MDTLLYQLIARAVDENGIDPNNIDVNTTDPMKIAMSLKYCKVGKCPEAWQKIEYQPNIPGNVIYMLCFLALAGGQVWYGVRNKTWSYMGTMVAGILGEMVGYIGRIMLSLNPFIMNNFLINLIPLTIAPALLTAGIYLCLGRVIVAKGSANSRLKPKMYTYIFVGCDLLALVLQAIGGGMAATARDKAGSRQGVNIMIAGLISQVITIALFLTIWGDFVLRTRHAKRSGTLSRTQPPLYSDLRSTKNFQYFQWSLLVATVLIFVRCIYRVAELWEGFGGHLANHEASFMVFEGPAIILAVCAMTIFHPGRIFGDLWIPAGKGVVTMNKLNNDESSVQLTETQWNHTAYDPVPQTGSIA
ncbi:RTA1-domain-containing protein [Dothidotthia symphoricarpi CBS 119687]|uniref:RTA1-domain-containing protein n=1 Tax=Dothidotthia symphoricarpi CBS 119687 TaxID=1392245 RepID=A0A6A6A965_9PLEO|nr:RTA1-domain-containing protein [Dothidotthia symphoricarpi CBS 119687]KAF2128512.1 RTA1-domain-containing protein [Dothidotthia symphoricarpi CBS 119687]